MNPFLTWIAVFLLALAPSFGRRLDSVKKIDIVSSEQLYNEIKSNFGNNLVVIIYDMSPEGIYLCRKLSYLSYKYKYTLYRVSEETFLSFTQEERERLGLSLVDLTSDHSTIIAMRGRQYSEFMELRRDGTSGVLPEAFYFGIIEPPEKYVLIIDSSRRVPLYVHGAPTSMLIQDIDWFFRSLVP